ncbi:hypothetical protein K0B03_02665 [Patescibacteria group bacterium]|nr:hypothetical protein [Patescibacteria group bacterium]
MTNNKKWDYVKTIEKMSDQELKKRIVDAMNFEVQNKIRPVPYIGGEELIVEYSYSELQAKCPMTGLKDIYKIKIKFIPDKFIPELKSLKFYFTGYEELPISHEHIIAKIYQDFKRVISPKKIAIVLYVAARGEILTTVETGDKELVKFSRPAQEENFSR